MTMKLIAASDHSTGAADLNDPTTLVLANTADPREIKLDGVTRIDLVFPKFTDGRAYSQAFLLRRRLGFQGEIRATGEAVLQMAGRINEVSAQAQQTLHNRSGSRRPRA